jgi:diketogulonate reductase-like aldo/keto reductase
MSSSSAAAAAAQPYATLHTGAKIARVGLGTWRSPAGEVEAAVYEALKVGYRHLDCARVYSNEAEVGRGIARAIKDGFLKREELHVTSKIWNNAHSAEHTMLDIQTSLKDLQLESIDLMLIHWPVNFKRIPDQMFPRNADNTVIHEEDESVASIKICYQTLEKAQSQGLVKAIGVSNFTKEQIDEVLTYAKVPPAALQVEVQPWFPQEDLIAYCREKNMIVQGYCPLGNSEGSRHGC